MISGGFLRGREPYKAEENLTKIKMLCYNEGHYKNVVKFLQKELIKTLYFNSESITEYQYLFMCMKVKKSVIKEFYRYHPRPGDPSHDKVFKIIIQAITTCKEIESSFDIMRKSLYNVT